MRADQARADRQQSVREAAAAWRRAGVIDDVALGAITEAYPDDRSRLSLGLRILAGLAALIGGGAFIGFLVSVLPSGGGEAVFFSCLAVVFTLATEVQAGRSRRRQAGAEYATAILAAVCAVVALMALRQHSPSFGWVCCAASVVFALAAWRWGYPALAAVAAVFLLVAFLQSDFGRAAFVVLGILAVPMIVRLARSPRLPPSHRRSAAAAGLVFLAGAYLAVNVYGLDHRWLAGFRGGWNGPPAAWARGLAILATILMPPLVLFAGIRFRARALIAGGALFTAASLVTFREYYPIGPWWLALILGGACCLVFAVAIRRWLESGEAHERAGYTAQPLFDDSRLAHSAQLAATLLAMSPAARVASEAQFLGGGGRSGGGGATGHV